jgi:hypothetical protein
MGNAVADLQGLLRNGRDCTSHKDSVPSGLSQGQGYYLGSGSFWLTRPVRPHCLRREPPLAGNELSATSH